MIETKKILLLEDRPSRQSQFLSNDQIEALNKIENVKMPKADVCVSIIEKINEGEAEVDGYDLIIVHKSSLNQNGLRFLKGLKKDLILFSGGLSQMVYQNEEFPLLTINSGDLYNNNFIHFLKIYVEGKVKILTELVYGDKWKLSILLYYRMIRTKLDKENDEYVKIELEEQLKNLENSFNSFPKYINEEIENLILRI
jgi:hypothetical protein